MNRKNTFQTLGNVELLSQKKTAVFASKNAPDELIKQANPVLSILLNLPVALAGGWQSPLEKSLYHQFTDQCRANLIHYIAKDINQFKPTVRQQNLLDQNKLLFIAPELKEARTSSAAVNKRDSLILSQNKNILFLFIEPSGRLEKYFRDLSRYDYKLYVLDHPVNESFFHDDVVRINEDTIHSLTL